MGILIHRRRLRTAFYALGSLFRQQANITKGEIIMLPFFGRFKRFFQMRYIAARNKRYILAKKVKSILSHDFIESSFSIVRLNLRGGN